MSLNGLDLSAIPGLGPARRAALAEVGVNDLKGLLAMRVAELAAVRGIGIWQARRIREFLRQRGLLVEVEDEEGVPVILVEPHTAEEVRVVNEIAQVLEAQAEAEAQLQAEVDQLTEAMTQEQSAETAGDDPAHSPVTSGGTVVAVKPEETAPVVETAAPEEAAELPDPLAVPEAGEAPTADEWPLEPVASADPDSAREALRTQRDQLPDAALVLMEAIRQAAVTKQLTRQITRLLITSGEFVSRERPLNGEAYEQAQTILLNAERLLHRAVEKAAFDPDAQKDLASRIRKRRKELEALLESAGE